MKRYKIKIFEKTSQFYQLRFFDENDNLVADRTINSNEIEELLRAVQNDYRSTAPYLENLGQKLYHWLDGPSDRWLQQLEERKIPYTLQIDTKKGLGSLPWELLHNNTSYLCENSQHLFTPVRQVLDRPEETETANRPLRLLFMASSPENVHPVLDFEQEEAGIILATERRSIDLVVEESGSLQGLKEQIEMRGNEDKFDVLHLSGHADIVNDSPIFIMEDELGYKMEAKAEDLVSVFTPSGCFPQLLFLSGCRTAQTTDENTLPSLCEALVVAGTPAVLGWALPVSDIVANKTAELLFEQLAGGIPIDRAVAYARQALAEWEYRETYGPKNWHLLRCYSDGTPLDALVTAQNAKDRKKIGSKAFDTEIAFHYARKEFLDEGNNKVEVCTRTKFIGRRRILQRCLRVLNSVRSEKDYAEGVLLHGMAGIGKSSTAARLCNRLSDTHKCLVWLGGIDEILLINNLSNKLCNSEEAIQLLNKSQLTLTQRLTKLFENIQVDNLLFVFDDFEQNIEWDNFSIKVDALKVLKPLLQAIHTTGSKSRIIVTSRYWFPVPEPLHLHTEMLPSFRGADLKKKLKALSTFALEEVEGDESEQKILREKAKQFAAGNPRLLERLNRVLEDEVIASNLVSEEDLKSKQTEFCVEAQLEDLLEQQSRDLRRTLALIAIYELPVELPAINVLGMEDPKLLDYLDRLAKLGLIEKITNYSDDQTSYFVSRLLCDFLIPELNEVERTDAYCKAVEFLYANWSRTLDTEFQEEKAQEIIRLGKLAKEWEITSDVASYLAQSWVIKSRYREAEELCQEILKCIDNTRLLCVLASAKNSLGLTAEAEELIRRARKEPLIPSTSEEIAIEKLLSEMSLNISIDIIEGELMDKQGDFDGALTKYKTALKNSEQYGNLHSQSVALHKMARINTLQGDLELAFQQFDQAYDLSRLINDKAGMVSILNSKANYMIRDGNYDEALSLLNDSLEILEETNDEAGMALAQNLVGDTFKQQGDIDKALETYQKSLKFWKRSGDIRNQANTLFAIAEINAQQNHIERSSKLFHEALELFEQSNDIRGQALILHELGKLKAFMHDFDAALSFLQESLELYEQIKDVQGQSVTLCQMACIVQLDDKPRAQDLLCKALQLAEQINDLEGIVAIKEALKQLDTDEQESDIEMALSSHLEEVLCQIKIKAWPEVINELYYYASLDQNNEVVLLAQAFWLSLHVNTPFKRYLALAYDFVKATHFDPNISPLVLAYTNHRLQLTTDPPPRKESVMESMAWIASEYGITPEQFEIWLNEEQLSNPENIASRLIQMLENLVPSSEWLFSREDVVNT